MIEPIVLSFRVACAPAHAFAVWTARTSLWWPLDHTRSGAPGLTVTFEPWSGGRIYERTPDGTEQDWGEVLVWEPPRRLSYLWHIAGPREDATEVEITFSTEDDGTLVTIIHRGWERLGARGPEMQERNRHGWAGLLPHYQRGCTEISA